MANTLRWLLPLLVILLGGGWYAYQQGLLPTKASDSDQQAAGGPAASAPPPQVAVLKLKEEVIDLTHELPGRVSAARQSQVRPQVDGIIVERLFEEGSYVEKGQQLYQIDAARYEASLNSALADLKSTQANTKFVEARSKRIQRLRKNGAVSQQDFEDVEIELEQAKAAEAVAQAAVDLAKVSLNYTKVYAPIAGRIGRSLVTEGALVTANQTQALTVITQLDPVYVDMQLSGVQVLKLQSYVAGSKALPVDLVMGNTDEFNYPHTGQLKFSEVTVAESTGSVTLRAVIPNPEGTLLPGLFVRAQLSLGQQSVILVPQRATTRTPEGQITVWKVDADNRARPTGISVSSTHGSDWVVTDGVSVGDQLIIAGYQKLGPGAEVSTTPWTPSPQH